MMNLKHNLSKQFIYIAIIIFGIVFISLGVVLPKVLLPIYEKNIYNYLKQPLEFIDTDLESNEIMSDIAYIFITSKQAVIISDNFDRVVKDDPTQVLNEIKEIKEPYGKLNINNKTYYYYSSGGEYISKIAVTNDSYINDIKKDVIFVIFPILLVTMLLILALIIVWTRRLVLKIYYLREKIVNIDSDNYDEIYVKEHLLDDELNALSKAVDDMHVTLKMQEEYKNQMYQSISHDFKTPITVMKSYIEAIEDGVADLKSGGPVIKDQLSKLESKVHSLLYLNKISYLKDHIDYKNSEINLSEIINSALDKFKYQKPDIEWEVKMIDKPLFNGTFDLWEAIVDNLLNNFIRYADKKIRIVVKKETIIFYNDGPHIEDSLINDLFNPYKKGIHGKFGLGLSIVEKSLCLMGYTIFIKNERKGVTFTISKSDVCKI